MFRALPVVGAIDLASQYAQRVAQIYQVNQLLAKEVYFSFVDDFA
jgi:hypothetical protein